MHLKKYYNYDFKIIKKNLLKNALIYENLSKQKSEYLNQWNKYHGVIIILIFQYNFFFQNSKIRMLILVNFNKMLYLLFSTFIIIKFNFLIEFDHFMGVTY